MTVLGPVQAADLGFVLPHEHIVIDNAIHHVPHDGMDPDGPLEASLLGQLRVRPHAVRANLRLDADDAVMSDLRHYRALGGGTLVELTPRGMGRDLELLARASRETGLRIICGTGWYVARGHPDGLHDLPVEALAGILESDLTGADPRAGVIGEIGISAEPHPDEWKVLDAALLAQRRTGAAVWIHQTTTAPMGHILDRIASADADLERVVLCHVDYDLRDLSMHRRALGMGLRLELDLFGFPAWNRGNFVHAPDDTTRLERILELAEEGYLAQLLVSQDVCMRTQLRRYGGYGYGHLIVDVCELFERLGGTTAAWQQLTRTNPAALLAVA